ncbi:MAG: riboflavin synthase [Bacteroidota bacterium]
MFTGIIEASGKVEAIEKEGTNFHIRISSPISNELKIDQSLSHNGVCLTVVELGELWHKVTAVDETMNRTSFKGLAEGDEINLERAMIAGARLDGHIVQGHVDGVASCSSIKDEDGSWLFTFEYVGKTDQVLVDKGSVCVNGVSLTVVNPNEVGFSVAIIPYTYEHTNFKQLEVGDIVNIEFDIIGKYIAGYLQQYLQNTKLG